MKTKFILSLITALFFGGISYLLLLILKIPDALLYAIFAGLLFYILLFLTMIIYEKAVNHKYRKFEKTITSPVFYKTNGNFMLSGDAITNANIYFCDDGIIIAQFEEKPYKTEIIPLEQIKDIRYDDYGIHLVIITNDEKLYYITLENSHEAVKAIMDKGWF